MRHRLPLLLLILFSCVLLKINAQGTSTFCSNTALIPVFKQDFGQGSSSTASTTAPAGSTNYNYGGVGTDGNYIVTPKVENAGKSDWTKGGDHTGNTNGNMFLVNAGGNRSIFLQQNVSGLCPGSSYSFTAWLANVNTPNTQGVCGAGLVYPKITFNIKDLSNNLLATYTTDILPLSPNNGSVNWIKYGFQFSLPTNITSLKLEIVDFRGGGAACGNDVALDDILFEACVPQISVSLNGNSDVCVGDSGKLQTTLMNSPYTNPAYLWQKSNDGGTTWDDLTALPNDSSNYSFVQVTPANAGIYRVMVAPTAANIFNPYCSAISNTVFFNVNTLPILQPSTNAPLCTGNNLQLKANPSGGSGLYTKYTWTGPNNFVSQASDTTVLFVGRKDTGNYTIQVTDTKGCKNNSSLFIAIDSTPVLNTILVTDTICSGNTATATLLSSISTSAYYWNASLLAGSIGGIGSITNPEYTGSRSAALVNTGAVPARIKYSVYAKNNNCISNTQDTIITIMPTISPANAGNDTTVCSTINLKLNANTPITGTGKWKQITGLSAVVFGNQQVAKSTISNLNPGVYTFEWSITGYCGMNADTVTITYIDKPTPSFTLSDTLICSGTSISITNTTTNIGHYNYQWNFGNGNSSFNSNINTVGYVGSNSGKDTSYIITLKAYSNCDTISLSKKITVRSKPKTSFTAQTNGNCFPITASFNFSSTADSITQRIRFGDSLSAIIQNASPINHTYQSTSNNNFYPTFISSNNCGADSVSLIITGYRKPTITFTQVTDTLCAGSTAQISTNSNITNSKYYWFSKQYIASDSSTINMGTNTNATQQYLIKDSIYAISPAGCKSNTIDTSIAIMPLSNTAIAGADSIICNTTNFLLYANSPVHASAYWKQISGPTTITLADSSKHNSSLPISTPGTYQLAWNIKGYCSTSADTVTIQYIDKPTTSFTLSDTLICAGNSVSLTNTTQNITSYSYLWNFGNGNSSSIANPSSIAFAGSSSGKDTSYTITLKAYSNCDTISISKKITVRSKPAASLIATPLNTCFPLLVSFTPTILGSEISSKFLFESGKDSLLLTDSSFSHTYFGNNTIVLQPILTVTNSCGTDSAFAYINAIANKLHAQNNLVDTAICGIPFKANFSNNTTGANTQTWNWGDGTTLTNPSTLVSHMYTKPGIYNITHSIQHICGDTTITKTITLYKAPNTSINPTNGYCVPFTVKLISESLPATSVSWNMGNDSILYGDSATFTYTMGGDYWVKMKATNTAGCNFTDSTLISIRSPQGKIDFKSGSYCNNNFTVAFNPSVQFTDRILWNFGDGTILETGVQTISHSYKKPGVYHPNITLISNTGCRVQLPITDSVVMENIKANFNTNTVYECGQTIFQFTDSSYGNNGITKYTWLTDGRAISNTKTASSLFNLTGTHQTQLIVEGKYGCTDTVSGAYNVNIYNLPKVNINSINEACLNSLMEFKSEVSSIDSVILRLWNLGNGKNFTDSAVRILYYDQGKYTVKLTVATVNKCYDSALKQITIHPVPQVKVAGPEKICVGETVELQAAGATNFVWKDQQDNIICNNCLTIKVKPLRNTQYKVIGYNEFGCTQISGAAVQVIDKPKIKIAAEDTICTGESTRLWVSGANSYQWLSAPGLTNNTTATQLVTPAVTTSYKVIGRDANNCFTDTATVRVVVGNPTPLVVGKDSVFVAGSKIQLRANVSTQNIIRWKWSGGADLSCVNCQNPIARVVFDECISCAATNIYGCTSNDTVCFKTFCPTTEVFLPNAFTPDGDGVNDVFFVQAKGVRNIKSFSIYNRWGELVFQKTNTLPNDPTQGWNGRIRGNLANPDVYVYICEIICEKGGTQLYKGNVAVIR